MTISSESQNVTFFKTFNQQRDKCIRKTQIFNWVSHKSMQVMRFVISVREAGCLPSVLVIQFDEKM